tara:strand:+ start:348 stop:1016 length:669 start_codon:yes stop_codon:yes gene_type:complete
MDGIFPFDEIDDGADLGSIKHPFRKKRDLFNFLLYDLALKGRVALTDKVETIRINEEEKTLYVITNRSTKIEASYGEIRIFDTDKISSPVFDVKNPKMYRVYDWYNVKSGLKHEHDFLLSGDDFCKKVYFYLSPRIDGNESKGLKDLVVESLLTKKQLHDADYSDSISRLKVISMMHAAGIKGAGNGAGRHLPVKLELNRREVEAIRIPAFEERAEIVVDVR